MKYEWLINYGNQSSFHMFMFLLNASVLEWPDPDSCSSSSSAVIRRPAADRPNNANSYWVRASVFFGRGSAHLVGTHYHPTLDPAVLWTPSNDTSTPIFSDSLNLMPPAPLYLRTLWRYTNAVIISGVASYGALGHVPSSTSNNFIFSSLWSRPKADSQKLCALRDKMVQMSTTHIWSVLH